MQPDQLTVLTAAGQIGAAVAAFVLVIITYWYAKSAMKQADQAQVQVRISQAQSEVIKQQMAISNEQVGATREQTAQLSGQLQVFVKQTEIAQEQRDKMQEQIDIVREQIKQQRFQFQETQRVSNMPFLLLCGNDLVHESKVLRLSIEAMSNLVQVRNVGQGPALNLSWKIEVGEFDVRVAAPELTPYIPLPPQSSRVIFHHAEIEAVTTVNSRLKITLTQKTLLEEGTSSVGKALTLAGVI